MHDEAGPAVPAPLRRPPAHVGERFSMRRRLESSGMSRFAASVDDRNPLHHDLAAALAAGYPGLIASGTQLGGMMMALTATHFAEPLADGTPRNGLGMGFDIRFRAVVLADEDIDLRWTVTGVEPKERLRGWIVTLDGEACSARGVLLTLTGTLLVWLGTRAAAAS